jgi:membrane fusion protein, copper/silver efflux system
MKRYTGIPAVGVTLMIATMLTIVVGPAVAAEASETQTEATRWTCSMHPQIILPDNSQQCPLCFMDLIPLEVETGQGLDPNELSLSESAIALAEIEVQRASRRSVHKEIRLVGKIASDQSRVSTITARFDGRLDRLLVQATGLPVTRGMKLADIYSPELYSAQAELQAAARAVDVQENQGRSNGSAHRTLDSVVSRLRLWGLEQAEIQGIMNATERRDHWPVTAPSSGIVLSLPVAEGDYVRTGSVLYTIADLTTVWAVLQAWESDIAWLAPGQKVRFSVRAFPGQSFAGRVLFIEPILDERSRTVAVRVEVANPDGLLKPGMLISAVAESPLNSRGALAGEGLYDAGDGPLVIPASAALMTGDRAVVYVRRSSPDGPVFAGREVSLGTRAGDHYVVLDGLAEGEEVVVRGNFKIDSALQIQARPSMMNPTGVSPAPAGHNHGAMAAPVTESGSHTASKVAPVAAADWGDSDILGRYLTLQTALAGDDDSSAAQAGGALKMALEELRKKPGDSPSSTDQAWQAELDALVQDVDRVANAADIAMRRHAFQPLSDRLWAAMEKFGSPTQEPVRRFHCPMAMDGAGADWIQSDKTTANPYYGAMMLRCGSQVEVLADAGHGTAAKENH